MAKSCFSLQQAALDEDGIAIRCDLTRDGTRFLIETAAAPSAQRRGINCRLSLTVRSGTYLQANSKVVL